MAASRQRSQDCSRQLRVEAVWKRAESGAANGQGSCHLTRQMR